MDIHRASDYKIERSTFMASRVYWKGLELTLNVTRRYIQKHQIQLSKSLTSEQYTCMLDVLTAITSCLALLPVNTPTPP